MTTEPYTISEDGAYVLFQGKKYRLYSGPKLQGERHLITKASQLYPQQLNDAEQAPEKLYIIGNPRILSSASLAVIGARRATPYGLACSNRFAYLAAEKGIVIVSGGAFGCDSQAHCAALTAHTPTIVFLGGGCDQVYPSRNFQLFQDIIDAGGAIVSENHWSFPALPYTFRRRNRLIAACAKAVLIVEAGLPSGTFSTADSALNAGREVLVVPGAITSHTSAGSNQLLYQGATPVVSDESFFDALFSFYGVLKERGGMNHTAAVVHDPLFEALCANPMRMDDILRTVHVPSTQRANQEQWLQQHLLDLELQGSITRYPDGRFGPAAL